MAGKVITLREIPPLVDPGAPRWASYLRTEVFRRKQIAAVTFGVEIRGVALMLETDWDGIAQRIDTSLGTCHPVLDEFFRARFSPLTTSWIHEHPELDGIARMFDRYQTIMRRHFDFSSPRHRDRVMQKR